MINRTEAEIMSKWVSNDTDTPVLSVRCLAYNHEKYIEKALDGFVMQETDFPFEVIVHDDASTDGTADIIRKYEKSYPHIIKPIYEKSNMYSRRDGSIRKIMNEACSGEYFAMCEGDDYWTDEKKLQKQVEFLREHPDYSLVFTSAEYLDGDTIVGNDKKDNYERDCSTNEMIRGGGRYCATPTLCYRADAALQRFGFQDIADVGDYPLQIMLSLRGKVRYLPDITSVYRVGRSNTESWTGRLTKDDETASKHWECEIRWMKALNEESGFRFDEAIRYRIAYASIVLFGYNKRKRNEIVKMINLLGGDDKRRARRLLAKKELKQKLPLLYMFFKSIEERKNGTSK